MTESMTLVPIVLTRAELFALTRRTQPTAQARWLTHAGWKFARDSDGYPIVAREEFQRNMIGAPASREGPAAAQAGFEVNLAALQQLRGVA
jgi:Domain of unknown function (DUF4224)